MPFVYSDEVWTGIEYQVASHMIAEGMLQQGIALVQAARSRYDGHVRNPWNEYECGSYYARAMSSYALLLAFTGFRYSAVDKALHLAPAVDAEPFQTFFSSTASGWGMISISKGGVEISMLEGELQVDEIHLTWHGKETIYHPRRLYRANTA